MESTQTGAVITFEEGVTPEEALELLKAIREVVSIDAREFNPEWGSPVFYVP